MKISTKLSVGRDHELWYVSDKGKKHMHVLIADGSTLEVGARNHARSLPTPVRPIR